jgi:hypothetical protein
LEVKELPPRTETYVTGDSLTVEPNNIFDKILKGKVYNEVKMDNLVRINSSESDVSKGRIAQVSVSFHSRQKAAQEGECRYIGIVGRVERGFSPLE